MQDSVGVIQTLGFPGILAAADAMVKAAKVTVVFFDLAESAQFIVVIRGTNSEVQRAIPAGLAAVESTFGCELINYYIVPNPPDNIVAILPIEYTEKSQAFR